MFNVQVQIIGEREALEKIKQMGHALEDWSDSFSMLGDYMQNYFENRVFETEGGIFNNRWSPLNPKYDAQKRSTYPGRGILERTGEMRHGWSRSQSDRTSFTLANNKPYAVFHQKGTGRMPARPLIIVDNGFQNGISDIFKKSLADKLGVIFK